MKKILLLTFFAIYFATNSTSQEVGVQLQPLQPVGAWKLLGNSVTTATDFIGPIDAQPLIFKTSNIQRAVIASNGNVGIGISTPAVKLHVDGGSAAEIIRMQSSGDAVMTWYAGATRIGYWGDGTSIDDRLQLIADRPSGLQLGVTNTTAPIFFSQGIIERMRLNSTGLGIWTNNPKYKLHIQTGTSAGAPVFGDGIISSIAGSARFINEDNTAAIGAKAMLYETYQGLTKFSSLNDTYGVFTAQNILTFNHLTGNIGVNTAAQSSRLHIDGSIALPFRADGSVAATQGAGDYMIRLNNGATQAITLLPASGAPGRIVRYKNTATVDKTITSYLDMFGASQTILPAGHWIELQSNGTAWEAIAAGGGFSISPFKKSGTTISTTAVGDNVVIGSPTFTGGVSTTGALEANNAFFKSGVQVVSLALPNQSIAVNDSASLIRASTTSGSTTTIDNLTGNANSGREIEIHNVSATVTYILAAGANIVGGPIAIPPNGSVQLTGYGGSWRVMGNWANTVVFAPMHQGIFTNYVAGTTANNIAFLHGGAEFAGKTIVGWRLEMLTNGYTAGSTVFDLKKNGTTVASITVTGSSTTIINSAATSVSIAAGDKFTIDTGAQTTPAGTLGLLAASLSIR